MTAITTTHIVLDDKGRALIDGTRTRVTMIVMDTMNGLGPQQISEAYPYLSLGQIHGALAYYYDHQAELDAQIERETEMVAASRKSAIEAGKQPSRAALKARLKKGRGGT